MSSSHDSREQLLAELEAANRRIAELETEVARLGGLVSSQTAHQLHALAEYSPAAIYLKDLSGRFIVASRSYREWFCNGKDIRGKTVFDIHPARKAELYTTQDQQVIQTHDSLEVEIEMPCPDGSSRDTWVVKFPVFDATGELIGVGGVNIDITARRAAQNALRESNARFKAFSEQTGLGVIAVADRRIVYANKSFANTCGRSIDELISWPPTEYFHRLVHPDDQKHVRVDALRAAHSQNDTPGILTEWRLMHADGSSQWVESHAGRIRVSDTAENLVYVQDITQRHAAQEALRNERASQRTAFPRSAQPGVGRLLRAG